MHAPTIVRGEAGLKKMMISRKIIFDGRPNKVDKVGSSGAGLEEDLGDPNPKQWGRGPEVVIPSPNMDGKRKGAQPISLKPIQIHPMP